MMPYTNFCDLPVKTVLSFWGSQSSISNIFGRELFCRVNSVHWYNAVCILEQKMKSRPHTTRPRYNDSQPVINRKGWNPDLFQLKAEGNLKTR